MIRKSSDTTRYSRLNRRKVLSIGVPAALVVVGGASFAGVGANAAESVLHNWFSPSREELEAELAARVEEYLASTGTRVEASIAVERDDMHLDYNGDQLHITASIVKMEILAMIQQYWGSADAIPAGHRELLERMITQSHNDSTTELFNFLGRKDALDAAHERYGLANTVSDPDGRWGLTETIAADQLILADLNLFEGALDAEQVELGRELMGGVSEAQAWGVSAAAKEGESVWLKNGWDVESQLGGLWVVNSIGVLGGEGDDPVKMAILTSGAVDDVEGVPIVERIAEIAREVIDEA
ncbi:hypothetical protein L0U85_10230 [Glycomyces sp. L485]|uniref:hypothetical protein n=1 Tax=Glycomyces sp. L485 TaxID=2909235 RepID=UPI001F4B4F88|nr:hypothetical protein [Glycomyces sp. L485]MCH7231225.1 hypothetical protein [Glycomyces sp. L485]